MAIAAESDSGPSAETLSLSASLFTSQISSWIPADFGQSSKPSTSSTKGSALDTIFLTEHDRGERLGLGHPLLELPKHQRRHDASSSLSSLGRRLGVDGKGKGKGREREEDVDRRLTGNGSRAEASEAEGEEEESRASIGKKRKVDRVDVWGGKKKAKTKTAFRSTNTTDTAVSGDAVESKVPSAAERSADSTPLIATSLTLSTPALDGLNKNQRKKLRKKQKKLTEMGR